jgi:hypothetical protein
MTLEDKMRLLDLVGELHLHRRLVKLKAKTVEQEWELLDRIVSEELRSRDAERKKGASQGPRRNDDPPS